jgi:acyl-CoA reductase-like NAD-dependent aldehyde dehydrogenase
VKGPTPGARPPHHTLLSSSRSQVTWINAHHRNDPSAPWGGFGASGIGRENGWDAVREVGGSSWQQQCVVAYGLGGFTTGT